MYFNGPVTGPCSLLREEFFQKLLSTWLLGIGEQFAGWPLLNNAALIHKNSAVGNITREAGPVKGGSTVIAFVTDPDGYKIELIQMNSRAHAKEHQQDAGATFDPLDLLAYAAGFGLCLLRWPPAPPRRHRPQRAAWP